MLLQPRNVLAVAHDLPSTGYYYRITLPYPGSSNNFTDARPHHSILRSMLLIYRNLFSLLPYLQQVFISDEVESGERAALPLEVLAECLLDLRQHVCKSIIDQYRTLSTFHYRNLTQCQSIITSYRNQSINTSPTTVSPTVPASLSSSRCVPCMCTTSRMRGAAVTCK